jgi:hypothetical protein
MGMVGILPGTDRSMFQNGELPFVYVQGNQLTLNRRLSLVLTHEKPIRMLRHKNYVCKKQAGKKCSLSPAQGWIS